MLLQLNINNLAIAESLELDFSQGMTVISGETGAGKSILLSALALILGDKADGDKVRFGTDKTDVSAIFEISQLPQAKQWLVDQDLLHENECIIRRTVNKEGRSRAYINGSHVPASHLKALAAFLMDIHSQHQHHHLLDSKTHIALLDEYGKHQHLLADVAAHHQTWRETKQALTELKHQQQTQQDHIALLRYQIAELDELALQTDELAELESQHQLLGNAEQIMQDCDYASGLLEHDRGARQQLLMAIKRLENYSQPSIGEAIEMLQNAVIQIEEASINMQHFCDQIEINPQKMQDIDERLTTVYRLAKKHMVSPHDLAQHHQQLMQQLTDIDISDEQIEHAESACQQAKSRYQTAAKALSSARKKAIALFDSEVQKQLQLLNMTGAVFQSQLQQTEQACSNGIDQLEFLVTANAGQPLKPLAKTASGGELSRISLAIQVVCAQNSVIPVLVFDEVDVGISGATSEVVGKLLRHLGSRGQVLCISHQPQVVAQAHHHLHVSKQQNKGETFSQVNKLDQQQKVSELARLLGGIEITEHTLAHAHEMLNAAQQMH